MNNYRKTELINENDKHRFQIRAVFFPAVSKWEVNFDPSEVYSWYIKQNILFVEFEEGGDIFEYEPNWFDYESDHFFAEKTDYEEIEMVKPEDFWINR